MARPAIIPTGSWPRRKEAEFSSGSVPKAPGDGGGGRGNDLPAQSDAICGARTAGIERRLSTIRPVVRRGLSRVEAAIYIGVGVTKFDALVASGAMPKPKRIDGRRVWDIVALDFAFDRLPDENGMPDQTWDDVDGA